MRVLLAVLLIALSVLEAGLLLRPSAEPSPRPRVTLDAERVFVPFEPSSAARRRPTVAVRIDGHGPFSFLVDTGAAGHGRIDLRLALRLELERIGTARLGDGTGRRVDASVVRIEMLSTRGARFVGAQLAVMDLERNGVDGILGFGLFDALGLTLDGPAGGVWLARDGGVDSGSALEVRGGVPWVELAIGGRHKSALIDSGAAVGVLLPPTWRDPRRSIDGAAFILRTAGRALDARRTTLRDGVRLGGVQLDGPSTAWVRGLDRPVIGWQVLRHLRVMFPPDRRAVTIRPAR